MSLGRLDTRMVVSTRGDLMSDGSRATSERGMCNKGHRQPSYSLEASESFCMMPRTLRCEHSVWCACKHNWRGVSQHEDFAKQKEVPAPVTVLSLGRLDTRMVVSTRGDLMSDGPSARAGAWGSRRRCAQFARTPRSPLGRSCRSAALWLPITWGSTEEVYLLGRAALSISEHFVLQKPPMR